MLRLAVTAPPPPTVSVQRKRELVAQVCKFIGAQLEAEDSDQPVAMHQKKLPDNLSPRMTQTLEYLLAGHSEKEVAAKMGLSVHTIHVHVKSLYKRLKVSSRGELLALCLGS